MSRHGGGDTKTKTQTRSGTLLWFSSESVGEMRLCHPPDGSTSPKYKLLSFITTKKIAKRRMH